MLDQGDRRRWERYKCLTTPSGPRVWQRPGEPDSAPFFFAWSRARSEAQAGDSDFALMTAGTDTTQKLRPRNRRDADPTLWNQKLNIEALLAASASGQALLDDDDDSTLSVCNT